MAVLPRGQPQTEHQVRARRTWRDWRPTVAAAVVAAGVVVLLLAAFGSVSPYERPVVLASLSGSVVWIAAALIGAASTVAALTLATVSLLDRLETRRMPPRVLFHLRLTVLAAPATIACAVGTLLLTTFPVASGVDVRPPRWQIDAVYFGLLALTALTVGAFAVVLTSLYATVAGVLGSLPQEWVEEILAERDDRSAARSRRRDVPR